MMERFIKNLADEEKNKIIRQSLLSILDYQWINHIEDLSHLKDGIGIRQYGQENPIRLFEFDGFELFKEMFFKMIYEMTSRMSETILYLEQFGMEDTEETFEIQEDDEEMELK